jgi:hypothetical protein
MAPVTRLDRFVMVAAFAAATSSAVPGAQAADPQQAADPRSTLAATRAALGGPAIDAIKSFSVAGTAVRQTGSDEDSIAIEIDAELPDKFVRREDRSSSGPIEFSTVTRLGFNGPMPIEQHVTHSSMSLPPPPPPVSTDTDAQALIRMMRTRHVEFARLVVPLLAASPQALALTFDAAPPAAVNGHPADVLVARAGAEDLFVLVIDPVSHLPARLMWKAPPILEFTTSGTVVVTSRGGVVSRGGPPPPGFMPPRPHAAPGTILVDQVPADPNAYLATLPAVQHELVFSQFETVAGVTWPRRWKEYADGQLLDDTRFGKFKINPTIDPKKFQAVQ